MLGRGVLSMLEPPNYKKFINGIKGVLPSEGHIIGNLEAPFLSKGSSLKSKDPHLTFKLEPSLISIFIETGIRALTLANNHITDYGKEGLLNTIKCLQEFNISTTGAGENIDIATKPIYFSDNSDRYAVLAFNGFVPFSVHATKNRFGYARFDRQTLASAIQNCESNVSGIIITVHWGIDYHHYPVPALINMAKEIIDNYPKVVAFVGHHPHLQQPVVFHNNIPIFCSLGNFIFDEPFPLSRIGSILSLNLNANRVIDFSVQYTRLSKDFIVETLDDQSLAVEQERLSIICKDIITNDWKYLSEDKKWIKYLFYQSLRYQSINDLTFLFKVYSVKEIVAKLLFT